MSDWIETELAEGQMHDVRHTKRLARLLDRLSARPVSSIPSACHGWAETVAAYRFLDNPAIGIQDILSGHTHATLERIRAQAVVLLVQDTTFLDYGTTQPKAGMGTVKIKVHEEYLLHPTVAFTPERVNVGVVGMKVWQRPEQPVAQQRKSKPMAEKESYRWLEGYHCACEVKQACPATLVVNMADREGDIQEWFVDVMRREPGHRAECIIRAKENRRLAPGAAQRYLWAEMQQTGSLGTLTIDLARQPDRPPRPVTLSVTAKPVTFYGARRPGGKLPPVTVSAVYAQEPSPPEGEEPVEWLLLTSLPVMDFPRACTVVQWYRCRWEIELFFRVLKQGCKIEQLRVQTDQRLLNALAIYLIVAWRIHNITMASRAYPDVSCEIVFEPREWHTLYTMQHHCYPPPTPPPLREMVRSLAQLGGFLARKRDGEPGIKTIWQGYQRLHEFIYAVDTYLTVNVVERSMP
jgi:Transposase DNA-binding/Transposase Tn5 dimerisation domain